MFCQYLCSTFAGVIFTLSECPVQKREDVSKIIFYFFMPCWPGVMGVKSLLLTLFSLSAPQAFLAPHLAPHAPSAASFFSNWADAPKLLCNQTYRNHVPFTTRLMKSWQYLKPGLQEMSIYCKNLIYVKLTHEDETGAIRKRKRFISRLRQY